MDSYSSKGVNYHIMEENGLIFSMVVVVEQENMGDKLQLLTRA